MVDGLLPDARLYCNEFPDEDPHSHSSHRKAEEKTEDERELMQKALLSNDKLKLGWAKAAMSGRNFAGMFMTNCCNL